MTRRTDDETLQLAIPKGRMYAGVARLLAEAGIDLTQTARNYRPHVNLPACEVKILKPQSIVRMLHAGSRDVGFAGAVWVAELDGSLVELADTGLDPVRVVAAAPVDLGAQCQRRMAGAVRRWRRQSATTFQRRADRGTQGRPRLDLPGWLVGCPAIREALNKS